MLQWCEGRREETTKRTLSLSPFPTVFPASMRGWPLLVCMLVSVYILDIRISSHIAWQHHITRFTLASQVIKRNIPLASIDRSITDTDTDTDTDTVNVLTAMRILCYHDSHTLQPRLASHTLLPRISYSAITPRILCYHASHTCTDTNTDTAPD